jgi:hypothetical protein
MTGVTRRTLLRAVPLGAAVAGLGGLATAAPAEAAVYGLPANAIEVSLHHNASWAGYHRSMTLCLFRLSTDGTSIVRSRMYYGQWVSVDDVRRLKPYADAVGRRIGNQQVDMWRGDGSWANTWTFTDHAADHRRLATVPELHLPAGVADLGRAQTQQASYVRYEKADGTVWWKCQHYRARRNAWAVVDWQEGSTKQIQYKSGYDALKEANEWRYGDLFAVGSGLGWAGNMIATATAVGTIAIGTASFACIGGYMVLRQHEVIRDYERANRYMDLAYGV